LSTHKTEAADSTDGVVVHPAPIPPSAVVIQALPGTAVPLVKEEKAPKKKDVKKKEAAPFD
jgi:hypothetical protein